MSILSSKLFTLAGVALLMIWGATDTAFAARIDFTHPAFVSAGNAATSIPIGHAEFCKSHKTECKAHRRIDEAAILTENKWQELLDINAGNNANIVAITDQQLYHTVEFWTYPNGYGDCEDFALAKRRELISHGWNPSTLLMAVVRQQNGEGHAVLMVRTDRGDLVLDNLVGEVKLWSQTSYRFLKRQSQAHAGRWVDLYDTRT